MQIQEEDFESLEEYEAEFEARLEAELEELANKPVYEYATLKEFRSRPTDFLVQKLWLKYTLSKKTVPEEVLDRMIAIIKKQVEHYSTTHPSARARKKDNETRLFKLRYFAEHEPDYFWELLHEADDGSVFLTIVIDNDMLETLRIWLPERRKFKPKELNSIFDALEKGEENPPKPKTFDGDSFRKRYKRAKVNCLIQQEKEEEELFRK